MRYYRLVLSGGAIPNTIMGTKEYICSEEQRKNLEETWFQAEATSDVDIFPWERKFSSVNVLGTAQMHQDSFSYEYANAWEQVRPLDMQSLDAEFLYVLTSDGTVERFVQLSLKDLKQQYQLLFPNVHTAVIAGDRDLISLKNIENDSENQAHFTNLIENTVYHYEMTLPSEAAARSDMEKPCAPNLRTFFDELLGEQ